MPYKPDTFLKSIEVIPQVKPEVHFLLNDCAEKIDTGESLSAEESDMLSELFLRLQDIDLDLVSYLLSFKENSILTKDEIVIVGVYFLASFQLGPSSEDLRDMFYYSQGDEDLFAERVEARKMPDHTRKILISVYKKVVKKQTDARSAT